MRRARLTVALRLAISLALSSTYACKSPEEVQRAIELRASKPFIEQLERTNACPGCDIKWADFTGKNFAGADLRGAQLFMIVAPDSNFRGANVTGGMLFGQLQRADLRDLILHDGSVSGELDGADLRGSIFTGKTGLYPYHANGARFDGLDLRESRGLDYGNWSGASLRGANLRGLVMNGMTGSYNRAPAVPLRLEAGYGGSRWVGADLREADLRDASFNSCDLSNADLRGAVLDGASFSGANLQGAQLSLDSLANADFGAATWVDGTKCDAVTSIGKCAPFKPLAPKDKRPIPKPGSQERSPSPGPAATTTAVHSTPPLTSVPP